MTKRLFAMAAVVVAALAGSGGPPAGAQSSPPPPAAITVDDDTPTPGQTITVTMRTCPAGALALFGVDLVLVGSARAGGDGVATAAVAIPPPVVPGAHTVSGRCLGTGLRPLFLRTGITVVAVDQPAPVMPPPAQPVAAVPPPAEHDAAVPPPDGDGDPGGTAGGPAPGGRATPRRLPAPSPDAPAGPDPPADAAAPFADAVPADGLPATAAPAPAANRAAPAGAAAAEPAAQARPEPGRDRGPLSTLARVALGLAAIGGVPVALAFSRGPRAPARRPRIPFLSGRLA
jgi:hypothetical protein